MDIIKVLPSPTFLSVLEELQTCPGAPTSVRNYFDHKRKLDSEAAAALSKKSSKSGRKPAVQSEIISPEVPAAVESPSSELLLLAGDVKWCHERMRERGIKHRIHELLNESSILLPAYKPPPPNPELQARLTRLRNEQANREYENMTHNIARQQLERNAVTGVGNEMRELHREVNRQIITGVQYIISIIGTFFALFVGLTFAVHEFAPRLITAVIGALIVGLAEIYFIIREDIRAETVDKKVK